ncbi:MAG: DNA internalization-related competence protein ComEC/Rec2, partial [Casimicrobiaceae bacterium]
RGRYGGGSGAPSLGRQLLLTQLLMAVGLAPITVFLFGQISLVGPLINAVAIPLVTLFVVPLALLWLVLPVDGLLWLSANGVDALTGLCRFATALPAALWVQHAPPAWAVVLALLGVLYLFAPPGWPWRWVGLVLWLPVFTVTPLRPTEGEFRLTALDVGQGTAVAIETARGAVLYDTGPRWNEAFDAGSRLIVPWLRATGNLRLHALVLSHLDLDHAGGAASVLAALPPPRFIANRGGALALALPAASRGTEHLACLAGMQWLLDGVRFEVLAPGSAEEARDASANDGSCVLAITSASGFRVLLPGDAERAAEARLIERFGPALRADVLIMGHHGARTSSSPAFIEAVAPAHAIVTVGFDNRYRHPHVETLARFAARGIMVHRTDRSGAIRFDSAAGRGQTPKRMRETARRYWRTQK